MPIHHKLKKIKRSINCFTCSKTIYINYFKVYNNLKPAHIVKDHTP